MRLLSANELVSTSQLAMARFHVFRTSGRGGFEIVLLLAGLAFAGLLVWAIERGGRPRIYRG